MTVENDELVTRWHGRVLADMSKDDLLDAFHELSVMYRQMRDQYYETLRMWENEVQRRR